MVLGQWIKDNLICTAYATRDEMGRAAAETVAAEINELMKTQETVNIVFAAAPSQDDMLSHLASMPVDWSRVVAFHMDEYVGLLSGSEKSFAHYLDNAIFGKVKMKQVYYIGTDGSEKACERYAELIKTHPIDIVCLGIGENAHIAFNDPAVADFADEKLIKRVELDEICRNQQVHDKTFDALDEVPRYALTLTVPTLVSAKCMVCTVPTVNKAAALFDTMTAPVSALVPATAMRRHKNAKLFADKDSASKLIKEIG